VVDLASGHRVIIPAMNASSVSFSPDAQHLVFAGSGYIWLANTDGSGLAMLGEGNLAAWQPGGSQ